MTRATAHTGAVTLIQRFGSALNLNIHLHMLFLDGVYVVSDGNAEPVFAECSHQALPNCKLCLSALPVALAAIWSGKGYWCATPRVPTCNPLDFIARLAALVPKPRVNLTRFHGVFAPNSKLRSQVTLSGRGKRSLQAPQTPAERHQAVSWAQRLKKVFQIDITQCSCDGRLKVIASIENAATIHRILDHLDRQARGPPLMPNPQAE